MLSMKDVLDRYRIFTVTDRTVSWLVFFILLITYWSTIPPTVSFWDCPEYVTAATRLVPGHPPGNPVWMLVERIVTLFLPGKYAALAINLSSGLFTALAGFFLSKIIFIGAVWVLKTRDGVRRRLHAFYAAGAAFIGALIFGWCDSVWYSAVEAEVYAMSIFLTALSVWLMLKWARASSTSLGWRYLILLAYIFGLSLGVHQLNLLVIPALAIVWALRRSIKSLWKILIIFIASIIMVGCILTGMMPSTIALAAEMELFAANTLGLPLLWGVAAYVALLGISLIVALSVTRCSSNRGAISLSIFPPVFLSGLFIFSGNFLVGAAVSALATMIIVRIRYFNPIRINLMMWMLAMLLTGYSAYALIPIRGDIPAPPNAAMPGNPFSFAAYQAREQYGAAPLLYGNTPYSRPMLREEWNLDSTPRYTRYVVEHTTRQIEPLMAEAVLRAPNTFSALTPADSVINEKALKKGKEAYIVRGYRSQQVLTPELNMWFPRLTGRSPFDIEAYAAWAGMRAESMDTVLISEALDTLGMPVAKMGAEGKRTHPIALRPTYLQNFQYLFGYQIGYMYLRYLMWNFSGRQNDIPSTGEVEHGNFITGISPLDNAMLSAEDALPPHAGEKNKGRNRYYMLPFLLGIWGIIWMCRSNWRGRMACAVVALLFIMTGVAIVIYLNQTPGEPRERDYTFLGSYMAFSIWIAAGALGLARIIANRCARLLRKHRPLTLRSLLIYASVGFIPSAGVAALMLTENYDDHDRSGRRAASRLAENILNSLEPNAVIFVDGDNFTFPLWYAQEVEGIRRDVRVINLSYLSSPRYAALVMRAWEDAPYLNSILEARDIIYHAHMQDKAMPGAYDTMNAREMLLRLKENPSYAVEAGNISLTLAEGDSLNIPVAALSRNGDSRTFAFHKLMMLSLIASNASSSSDSVLFRPFYWQKNLPSGQYISLRPHMTDRIFAYRLGKEPAARQDSALIRIAHGIKAPNDASSDTVYLDRIPASMMARMRGDIGAAAKRLLRNGHKEEALELALRTHREYGADPHTLLSITMGDSIFRTEREWGALFVELADTFRRGDLRKIGEWYMEDVERRNRAWTHYRNSLSPRMRPTMSKNP